MKRWLIAALALPLAGLAANIAASAYAIRGTTEFRIPVSGYDPRDPIRGQYIRFRYDWRLAGPACPAARCDLCLADDGATVRNVVAGEPCRHRVDLRRSAIETHGGPTQQYFSRLFVSETSAPALEAQLRLTPMIVVARLGRDGRLVNQRIEPRGE